MKSILNIYLVAFSMIFFSCESIVDDINDNPNAIVPDEIEANFFLTGAILANNIGQAAHTNRIAGLYSGQLEGFTSLYGTIYGYTIATVETNSDWRRFYTGVVPQVRLIREKAPDDLLLVGISKVLEAHAVGTAASLYGDVPYREINDLTIPDPAFDDQRQVLGDLITLLNSAVTDLETSSSRPITEDLYFSGDVDKWIEVAYTLIARYYLWQKDYNSAYSAALNGISSADGTMKYTPTGDESTTGNDNLFWEILAGSRSGDIGTGDSYLIQLIRPGSALVRNHTKTNEKARFDYYEIDEADLSGKISRFEPHLLVTYEENLLLLAETGTRTESFNTGLGHLNELRQYLNTGGFLNENFQDSVFLYSDFDAADFQNGGIENEDNIDAERALLREIIEERYVTGFGTFMPFNDSRRLRNTPGDSDLVVPFPLNTNTATQHVERLPYPQDEIDSNVNLAEDIGIYTKTPVNM